MKFHYRAMYCGANVGYKPFLLPSAMFAPNGAQQQALTSVQLQASGDGQSNFYADAQTGGQLQANMIYALPNAGGSSFMNVAQGGSGQQGSDGTAFLQQGFNAQQQFVVQGGDSNGGMQQSAIMTVGAGSTGQAQFGMASNFGMAG